MPSQSTRGITDAQFVVTANYNVGGAFTTTNAIDLGQAGAFPVSERVTVQISTTIATGANNKNVNIVLEHANTNANASFKNCNIGPTADGTGSIPFPILASLRDNNNTNVPAMTWNVSLPPDALQFIRLRANVEGSGNPSANNGTYTLKVLF